jgi:hypothetical protein
MEVYRFLGGCMSPFQSISKLCVGILLNLALFLPGFVSAQQSNHLIYATPEDEAGSNESFRSILGVGGGILDSACEIGEWILSRRPGPSALFLLELDILCSAATEIQYCYAANPLALLDPTLHEGEDLMDTPSRESIDKVIGKVEESNGISSGNFQSDGSLTWSEINGALDDIPGMTGGIRGDVRLLLENITGESPLNLNADDLAHVFDSIDANGDGQITSVELEEFLSEDKNRTDVSISLATKIRNRVMFILGLIDSGLGKVAAKLLGVDQEELQEIRASLQKLLDYLNELLRKLEELKKKWQTNVAPLESVM